jgi:hypothetical protein
MKNVSKVVYTLNIDDYAPEIRALTYPFMKYYARRIGAEFCEITERKFPEWPIVYEKFQIGELARKNKADWHIFFDADTLIHPEMLDWTNFISKDTVCQNGHDFAGLRWEYDEHFLRDGRNIGTCNWCTMASSWCLDLWHLSDLPVEEVIRRCSPTVAEWNCGLIDRQHLVDDYVLSRNVARFGLKYTTLDKVIERTIPNSAFLWHIYTVSVKEKVKQMEEMIKVWNVPDKMFAG